MTNTQLIPISLFFLSCIVGIIGFFLRSNWEEIKNTNKEILKKLDSLTISFTEIKVNSINFQKDLEFCENEIKSIKILVEKFSDRLHKLEVLRDNNKSP